MYPWGVELDQPSIGALQDLLLEDFVIQLDD
jgi:hypothetical protein